jgi:hypothetical protein
LFEHIFVLRAFLAAAGKSNVVNTRDSDDALNKLQLDDSLFYFDDEFYLRFMVAKEGFEGQVDKRIGSPHS